MTLRLTPAVLMYAAAAAMLTLAIGHLAPARAQAPDQPPVIALSAAVAAGRLTVTARATDDRGITCLSIRAPSVRATVQPRPPTPWAYCRGSSNDERALDATSATATAVDTAGHTVTQAVEVRR